MDKNEFDTVMRSTRCKNCKAIPEMPYDGMMIIKKYGDLMSEYILCSSCSKELEERLKENA